MADVEIELIPCRSDNYAVLVHDPMSGATALVDAPDASPIAAALERRNWRLTHILVTHHHFDHVDGVEALKGATAAVVIAPASEAARIPVVDTRVKEGDRVGIGSLSASVIETPGHTAGHVSYWFEDAGLLFSGDTLFALGCGRLFEGSAEDMWRSLQKLAALPPDTTVYCGHEYTLSNAAFATTVDPHNTQLAERRLAIADRRERGEPTIPTTIGEELATNPFLRAGDPAIAAGLDMAGASPDLVFAELRRRKDRA